MENYQLKLDNFIQNMTERRNLLLHSCCAPCSSYVLTYLLEFFDVTLFYYNPNIQPEREYRKRADEQKRLCDLLHVPYIEGEYDTDRYLDIIKGLETESEGGARCTKCFEMRLDRTAQLATTLGIDLIATTLTVSPHKNAPLINTIGEGAASKYGIGWLPSDFKKRNGYLESIRLSKEYELYRQTFCGCSFSVY